MKQTLGLLKNKTHTLNSFKENMRLKTNQIKGPQQSNILKPNSLLLNSQSNSAVSTDANISIELQASNFGLSAEWAEHYYYTIDNISQIKEIIKELQILGTVIFSTLDKYISKLFQQIQFIIIQNQLNILKMQFGDTSQIEKSIYDKNQIATTKIFECEKKTQQIQKYQNRLESHSEKRIRENISMALSQQITEITYLLRNQQKRMVTMIKCASIDPNSKFDYRQYLINQYLQISAIIYEIENFLNINEQKQIEFKENNNLTFQEEQLYDQIQQENDQEINKLVQMINDLAQVFQSLNQLVLDQGHLLDRIDQNIDQAYMNIKKVIQLINLIRNHLIYEIGKPAIDEDESQNSPLANKCIQTLLVLIFICSIMLVIKYSS